MLQESTLQESTLEDPSALIPGATGIYDLRPASTSRQATHRARIIRAARAEVTGLREALAAGWDVALEVAHQEQLLAELEDEDRAHAVLAEALLSDVARASTPRNRHDDPQAQPPHRARWSGASHAPRGRGHVGAQERSEDGQATARRPATSAIGRRSVRPA